VVIRPALPDEAEVLARFAERTFREAFAADNRPEDMDAYCAAAFTTEVMRVALADTSITTLVMVTGDGDLAAYAQLRPEAPEHDPKMLAPLELWRFYVDRAHHGRGMAQHLMDAVFDASRARGAVTLWLGVWEHNTRAQAFYRKFGFAVVGSHTFVLGTDAQTDHVMARRLRDV
jgi:ribosomal protein S18 acetylase RimI-like enzyme